MSADEEHPLYATPDPSEPLISEAERKEKASALVMVKCRHVDKHWEIATALRTAGYVIPTFTRIKLGKAFAHALYKEHAGKPFFLGLIDSVTNGEVALLLVQGPSTPDFYTKLRQLVGPTNPRVARADEPTSLRGRFTSGGDELPHNAVHCSDSLESARRELDIITDLL